MNTTKNSFILIYEPQSEKNNNDGDCGDCACSNISEVDERIFEPTNIHNYRLSPDLTFIKLTDGFIAAANPANIPSVVVMSENAYEFLLDQKTNQDISTQKLTELIKVGLLSSPETLANQLQPAETDSTLVVWLHVSNSCPLTCSYCYIAKSAERMELKTGLKAVHAIFNEAVRNGFQAVKIKYAGGEPTLNLSVVEAIHKEAQKLAFECNIGLDEVLLTSGIMNSNHLRRIEKLGIRVMISLDALDFHHDNQRPMVKGNTSSVRAINSLEYLFKAGLDICVSITISSQPARAIIDLIDYLLDRDIQFTLNFARDNQYFNQRNTFLPQHPTLIETCISIINHLSNRLPPKSLGGVLLDRASIAHPHHFACGVGRSYLVIDQQGNVAKCQQEIETTVSSVYEQDLMLKVINSPIGVQNLEVNEREGCKECNWRYWCAGGCSALAKQASRESGSEKIGRSPYCDVYKSVFPHMVRLEGLRLLQYRPHQVVL